MINLIDFYVKFVSNLFSNIRRIKVPAVIDFFGQVEKQKEIVGEDAMDWKKNLTVEIKGSA